MALSVHLPTRHPRMPFPHPRSVFLGRPQLIRNPYLRSKMIDVLWQWLPSSQARALLH